MKTLKSIYYAITELNRKIHQLTTYFAEKITQANAFFKMLAQVLFPKTQKFLKFSDKVALENCILVCKSLHKSLPKIFWLCKCSISLYQILWYIFCYCKYNTYLEFFAKSASGNPTLSFKNKVIESYDY